MMRKTSTPAALAAALFFVVCSLSGGRAAAQPAGSGLLTGKGLMAVRGCGRDQLSPSLPVRVRSDGTWSALPDIGGELSGPWTARDPRKRRLELDFDAPSFDAFRQMQARDMAELCGAMAVLDVTTAKRQALLVIARRDTRATLRLRFVTTGTVNGRRRTARLNIRLAGRWVAD